MNKIKELKLELKEAAAEIRKMKASRKSCEFGYVPGLWEARWHTRHKHIAYCMLRGRSYEEIESAPCRPDNLPNMALVEKYMEEYSYEPEDVCVGT